jgi:RNA polymerase sigma factor (sigma-70 family)
MVLYSAAMGDHEAARRTIAAIWKIESAKVIAGLARIVRDVGLAEELAQDALVAALERWPVSGVPDRPGAWLMATAKNRAIDLLRKRALHARKEDELLRETADQFAADADKTLDDAIGDDLLRLIFTACHPVLPAEARTALTLRMVGGLATDEIARAFLVSEATVAQRIVRAKRRLAEAKVPFEVPHGEELAGRLASVLEVVYLIFNEGYSATEGADWMRPALCEEALRLGRILAGLAPDEPEVHSLAALMEIQASRAPARIGPDGEPILLLDQNRARWDQLLIGRGLAALERARALLGGAGPGEPGPRDPGPRELGSRELGSRELGSRDPGPYLLQAEIAACHARARAAAETDWPRIAALYGALARLTPSPVVELNRAVAIAMADGPAAGLALADALSAAPELKNYHLLPSVRGDFLFRLGRHGEARAEFERAAGLTRNARERALLLDRAAACGADRQPGSGEAKPGG